MRFSASQKYGKNSKTEKISTEVAMSQLQGQDWKKCDDKPYKTDFQVLIMMVDLSDLHLLGDISQLSLKNTEITWRANVCLNIIH